MRHRGRRENIPRSRWNPNLFSGHHGNRPGDDGQLNQSEADPASNTAERGSNTQSAGNTGFPTSRSGLSEPSTRFNAPSRPRALPSSIDSILNSTGFPDAPTFIPSNQYASLSPIEALQRREKVASHGAVSGEAEVPYHQAASNLSQRSLMCNFTGDAPLPFVGSSLGSEMPATLDGTAGPYENQQPQGSVSSDNFRNSRVREPLGKPSQPHTFRSDVSGFLPSASTLLHTNIWGYSSLPDSISDEEGDVPTFPDLETWQCPQCGKKVYKRYRLCIYCPYPFRGNLGDWVCEGCGYPNAEAAEACYRCDEFPRQYWGPDGMNCSYSRDPLAPSTLSPPNMTQNPPMNQVIQPFGVPPSQGPLAGGPAPCFGPKGAGRGRSSQRAVGGSSQYRLQRRSRSRSRQRSGHQIRQLEGSHQSHNEIQDPFVRRVNRAPRDDGPSQIPFGNRSFSLNSIGENNSSTTVGASENLAKEQFLQSPTTITQHFSTRGRSGIQHKPATQDNAKAKAVDSASLSPPLPPRNNIGERMGTTSAVESMERPQTDRQPFKSLKNAHAEPSSLGRAQGKEIIKSAVKPLWAEKVNRNNREEIEPSAGIAAPPGAKDIEEMVSSAEIQEIPDAIAALSLAEAQSPPTGRSSPSVALPSPEEEILYTIEQTCGKETPDETTTASQKPCDLSGDSEYELVDPEPTVDEVKAIMNYIFKSGGPFPSTQDSLLAQPPSSPRDTPQNSSVREQTQGSTEKGKEREASFASALQARHEEQREERRDAGVRNRRDVFNASNQSASYDDDFPSLGGPSTAATPGAKTGAAKRRAERRKAKTEG